MFKNLSKFFAKRYIERHKEDGPVMGLTDFTFKAFDLYLDFAKLFVLYLAVSLILILGVTTVIYFLTSGSVLWTIITLFVMCIPIFIAVTILLSVKFIKSVKKEILTLYKTLYRK